MTSSGFAKSTERQTPENGQLGTGLHSFIHTVFVNSFNVQVDITTDRQIDKKEDRIIYICSC